MHPLSWATSDALDEYLQASDRRHMRNHGGSAEPLLFSVNQVAKLIGFSRTKTYEMVQSGKIPSILVENRLRITRQALYAWIAKQPRSTPHARARSF